MKKVAVILNGSGHRDGSEIHEAVLTLLGIELAGATWEAIALDKPQARVINHINGEIDVDSTSRSMLEESARIARGRIKDLRQANIDDYVAVVIPGGNGTASNLCDFATAGSNMSVVSEVASFLEAARSRGKPIGAVCIAPMILAKVFSKKGVQLTLGAAEGAAAKAARTMGASVIECKADDCIVDEAQKIVTTPAYMLDANIAQIAEGIFKLARQIVRLS